MAYHPAAAEAAGDSSISVSRSYAWVVFALTFGLLVSDYMSRQVPSRQHG